VFDKNGDKTISAGEIRSIMKAIGSPLTTADVDQLLALADTNADGAINYEGGLLYILIIIIIIK
jgi:Ca2+-binding EF-hand superfamily protein